MRLSRRFADSPELFLPAENSAAVPGFPEKLLSRSLSWMQRSQINRSGRPVGVGRPLQAVLPALSPAGDRATAALHLGDERVLTFVAAFRIEPGNRALTFAVELGLHGTFLGLVHSAHVLAVIGDVPLQALG